MKLLPLLRPSSTRTIFSLGERTLDHPLQAVLLARFAYIEAIEVITVRLCRALCRMMRYRGGFKTSDLNARSGFNWSHRVGDTLQQARSRIR